jgi:hypothetical protein
MRVVVVYESLFGNTREVAEAIAAGVAEAGSTAEVVVARVGETDPNEVEAADLLVVGGPTHMRGMTSALSRKLGASADENKDPSEGGHDERESSAEGPGVRNWLHGLPKATRSRRAAAFDTRVDSHLAGGAGDAIARRLRRHGYELIGEPEGFIVEDVDGPLRAGELARARAWAVGLVTQTSQPQAGAPGWQPTPTLPGWGGPA